MTWSGSRARPRRWSPRRPPRRPPLTGLTPATAYTFAVYARDARRKPVGPVGRQSRSPPAGTTPPTPTRPARPAGCVRPSTTGAAGFSANITITNTGTTTINGWTLRFTFPGNQQITNSWSATWSQQGQAVTATSMSWNGTLAPGASTGIGFNGSYSGAQRPSDRLHDQQRGLRERLTGR